MRDLGHRDAGGRRELAHRFEQPRLGVVARRVDHLRAGRPLRDRLRHQQRNDRAGEADDERIDEQLPVLECPAPASARSSPKSFSTTDSTSDDREIGGDEQDDSFHGWPRRDRRPNISARTAPTQGADAAAQATRDASLARRRDQPVRLLRPGIAQRHRAIEDRPPGRVIDEVGDEIAVPLELEALLGGGVRERRLDEAR